MNNVNLSTQKILMLAVPSNVNSSQMSRINRAISDAARIKQKRYTVPPEKCCN